MGHWWLRAKVVGVGKQGKIAGRTKTKTKTKPQQPQKPFRKGKIQDLGGSDPKDKEHSLRASHRKSVLWSLGQVSGSWPGGKAGSTQVAGGHLKQKLPRGGSLGLGAPAQPPPGTSSASAYFLFLQLSSSESSPHPSSNLLHQPHISRKPGAWVWSHVWHQRFLSLFEAGICSSLGNVDPLPSTSRPLPPSSQQSSGPFGWGG